MLRTNKYDIEANNTVLKREGQLLFVKNSNISKQLL